jgi:oligopeptide/dipeptide ABC transporter ATP-binding protein
VTEPLLRVENLTTEFRTERGVVRAVNEVSYEIDEGEIVGLVGESGSGKSVSQLSVMRLIASPPGFIVGGRVLFEGKDLLQYQANGPELRAVRGAKIAMVFQEPMTSLNPVLTIGFQLREMLELHLGMTTPEARKRAVELLKMVGVPDAQNRTGDYPHQFSGGMRQRVMVAMAISCNPRILIADEATTALDATTQLQLLELLCGMVQRLGTALVIVTHNLGVVARYAQRVYVMYAGRMVEHGSVDQILLNPRHRYTMDLLRCVPSRSERGEKLVPIAGTTPDLMNLPDMCSFSPRCRHREAICEQGLGPPLEEVEPGHYVACHLAGREEQRVATPGG